MGHHVHLPAAAWLILAPAATLMLADDLRKRVASSRYRTVSPDDQPILYHAVTAMNVGVVFLAWWFAFDLIAGWLR